MSNGSFKAYIGVYLMLKKYILILYIVIMYVVFLHDTEGIVYVSNEVFI